MDDVYIGKGKLAGKGVYAARTFAAGELVKHYSLRPLTQVAFDALPKSEQMFVHSFWGKMFLFLEPSRYTNHSPNPNTKSDLQKMCDIATRSIKVGEMITTNATLELRAELETFIEVHEKTKQISDFKWLKGGYRNAEVSYLLPSGEKKSVKMKRLNGNWRMINEVKVC